MTAYRRSNEERWKGAIPAVLAHLALGFVFLQGMTQGSPAVDDEAITLLELPAELPSIPAPPPPPPPAAGREDAKRRADPREEGAASPPNLLSDPTPFVAPEPIIQPLRLPPLPAASLAGTGSDPSAGAAPVRGPGMGSGGLGTGTGSGNGGDGLGGGGGGGGGGDGAGSAETPPRRLRGRLRLDDLPAELEEAGVGGVVQVRYAVETDGRVTGCVATASSGSALLDRTTCRLIEQRYRYRPSLDAAGRPVRSFVEHAEEWVVELLPPDPNEEPVRRRRRIF